MQSSQITKPEPYPMVSVIIPTYRDWHSLTECLIQLSHQSYPSDAFEVIVVNNDPENTFDVRPDIQNFVLLTEEKPGSYAARNLGIKHATGDIIAFTDADCLPKVSWIENGVKHLKHGAERVAGKVEFIFKGEKLTSAEMYDKAFGFDQKKNADRGCSITANLFVYKKYFDLVGLFDDRLMSGGDIEWGKRASNLSISIVYGDDTIVFHPARSKLLDIFKKARRVAGGIVSYGRNDKNQRPLRLLLLGFLPPIMSIVRTYKKTDLTLKEKIVASLLAYVVKFYSTYYKLLLICGLKKPNRT